MVYPPSFPPANIRVVACPAKLPVIDLDTQDILLWVDDGQAREMIKGGKARFLRTKKRIYGLTLIDQISGKRSVVKPTILRRRGTTGDSHNHERPDNPERVWTIDRIGKNKRGIFLKVVTDCLSISAPSQRAA